MVEYPLAEEVEEAIAELKARGEESGWAVAEREALFGAFDGWLADRRLLDRVDGGMMRVTVLNELTWLTSHPVIGEDAWEHIRGIVKDLGKQDHDGMRESWIIANFELTAEPPEVAVYLERLFSLAGDEETRWAIFGAYENFPWRLRPHAGKYSGGLITDEDCDAWLIEHDHGEDEILMRRDRGEGGGSAAL